MGLKKYSQYCTVGTQCVVASQEEARLEAQASQLEMQLEKLRAFLSTLKEENDPFCEYLSILEYEYTSIEDTENALHGLL